MVSPSKKRKLEAKGKASSTTVRGAAVTGDCRLLKSQKPLADKKFYLDFKNHGVAVKIESRLKSLGASVEVFLAKEVNYAVTDRPEWSSNNSGSRQQRVLTPQWLASPMQTSASPSTFNSPAENFAGTRRLLQRSRAVAMLEKAKQQHTHLNTIDPLENAVRWGVPIWPVDKVLKWLDKIEQSLNSNLSTLSIQTKCLKTPYVKLETLSKKYRPVYSSLDKWPTINLDCIDTCSPFTVPKPPASKDSKSARNVPQQAMLEGPQSDQRMTRKTRVTLVHNDEPVKAKLNPGFCEVCDTDFNDIEQHLNSSVHLKFVHDSTNYQDLDTLIKEGPSVEELLKAIDPVGCATRRSPRGPASPPWLSSDGATDTCDVADIMRRPTLINGQLRRTSQRQADERSKAAARKETSETFMNGSVKKCKIPFNDGRPADEDRSSGEFSHNLRSRLAPIEEAGYKRLRSRNSEGSASAEGSSDSRDSSKLDGCSDGEAAHCSTRSRAGLARTRGTRNSSSGSDSKRDNDGHAAADAVNGKDCCCEDDSCCTLPGSKCSTMKGKPIKKKRLSVEEKLLEDNKEYFKLEVINAKLRSSGYFCNQRESTMEDMHAAAQGNNDSDVDTGGHKDEALVKTRRPPRPRRSELSVLNDEADSYLFGDKSVKKEVQSPTYQNAHRSPLQVHIYADECANHVPSAPLGEQALLPGIKEELMSPHPDDACHSGSNGSPLDGEKKKRRTHAEVFIHDNFDYYKFPLPESRLRLHNASNPHSPEKTESEEGGSPKVTAPPSGSRGFASSIDNIPESKTRCEDIAPPELSTFPFVSTNTPESVERMRFSFESIPRSEPWFQTYQRQDEGEEMLEPYSDFMYEKRVKLPYEMSSDLFLSKLIRGKVARGRGRGRGRLKLLPHRSRAMQLAAAARNPRKSPRCHASTLAILSSFMNKRRRHSVGVVSDAACPPTLETIPEGAPDFQEIEKRIDEMLASPPSSPTPDSSVKPLGRVRRRSQRRAVEGSKDNLDVIEHEPALEAESMDADNPVSNVGEVGLKTSSEVDVVNLLDEFPKCNCVEDLKTDEEQDDDEPYNPLAHLRLDLDSECGSYDTMSETGTNYSSAKGKLKKRKTNRTGWPAKRKQKKKEPDFNDKKKKLEVEPTKDFVGVRIKRLPITSCGEVHMVYRTTSCRGRGRRGASSSRASVPLSRSSRTLSDSRSEATPVKSPHSGSRVNSSRETQDDSRSPRSSSSLFSSSRVREASRKNQTRTKAKWGSTSLRHRR